MDSCGTNMDSAGQQDCPAFIKRIARSLALTKGVSGRSNETPERSKPEWR